MLPRPSSTFTIPSLHDDTQLECRLYHPTSKVYSIPSPETKAVTIAHPYTPLGGCFDDHVLHAAGSEFLNRGYILGLFNLRGAGASKGSSSWTSRPEQDDYLSFAGFLACYMEELHRSAQASSTCESSSSSTAVQDTKSDAQTRSKRSSSSTSFHRTLILGGYSYGSLLVRALPSIDEILSHFSRPLIGGAAAEIRLRAAHIARERTNSIQAAKPCGRTLHVDSAQLSPSYGGDESLPGTRRLSHESRRSTRSIEDVVRRTVEKSRGRLSKESKLEGDANGKRNLETLDLQAIAAPEIRYILISPLLPPLSSFLALSIGHWPWSRSKGDSNSSADGRLAEHDTLAVWGSEDAITSSKRLRKWAGALQKAGSKESRFQFNEINGAGHFWLEEGVEVELRACIGRWVDRTEG